MGYVKKKGQPMRKAMLFFWIVGVTSSPALAQQRCVGDDYVLAWAWNKSPVQTEAILLATPEKAGSVEMRFRAISIIGHELSPLLVTAFSLAKSANVALIGLNQGSARPVDLTRAIRRSFTAPDAYVPKFPYLPEQQCQSDVDMQSPAWDEKLRKVLLERGFSGEGKKVSLGSYSVAVDPLLYAPAFEFAYDEPVHPTSLGIWELLNKKQSIQKKKPTGVEYGQLYRTYQEQHFNECIVHYRVPESSMSRSTSQNSSELTSTSKDGTWIIEYWLYYPFDVAGTGTHLHDSEHVFVEVDKLGGTVRRMAGAGHGIWAPNNIVGTFSKDSVALDLPLYAMVERGKHATAPDANRDGIFTPGVDTNTHLDPKKVWGVRDTVGSTDSNIRSFNSTMGTPRKIEQAWRPSHFVSPDTKYQFDEPFNKNSAPTCQFQELRDEAPPRPNFLVRFVKTFEKKCPAASAACAKEHVVTHDDYREVNHILKPALYPPFAIRGGYMRAPTPDEDSELAESSDRVTAGIAFEPAALGFGLPGRIGVDAVLEVDGSGFGMMELDGFSVRYEWLQTNLFGLYTGLSRINDDLADRQAFVENLDGRTVTQTFDLQWWVSAGLMYEMQISNRLTFSVQGGIAYNNFFRLNKEIRSSVSYGFRKSTGKFGIRGDDRHNPY